MQFKYNPIAKKLDLVDTMTTPPPGSVIALEGDDLIVVPPDVNGVIHVLATPTAGGTTSFSGSGSNLSFNTSTTFNLNTCLGFNCGNNIIGVSNCTALGYGALNSTVSGGGSATAVGSFSQNANANGNGDTSLGSASLTNFTGPAIAGLTRNTAIGNQSLIALLTGVLNIALGFASGASYLSSESSNIVIGNTGTASESNTTRIGTQGSGDGQQNRCFIAGIVGVSPSNPVGVTIDPATGQLGVGATSFTWALVTASGAMVKNRGSIVTANAVSLSLPTTASSTLGDIIELTLSGGTSWAVTQAAGQQIRLGNTATTVGVAGSLASTAQGDTIRMVYQATGLWVVLSIIGNITVV